MALNKPHHIVVESEQAFAAWNGGYDTWNAYVAANPHAGPEREPYVSKHATLAGSAAVALWQQGKEAWNAWVSANQYAAIDFSEQHFEASVKNGDGRPTIDFSDFVFPIGGVSFDHATFGMGYVNFWRAKFQEGDVSFEFTAFGEGIVNFAHTRFGAGNVSFVQATFGEGDVSFELATFDRGNVNFSGGKFGKGDVIFLDTTFGEGDVIFCYTTFGEGNVNFNNATLNKGFVDFSSASFGPGAVSLQNLAFEGVARFDGLKQIEHCTKFSFEGCSFDKLFTFSHEGRMGCPLDLRRTKLSHGIVLNDVKCDYAKEPISDWTARCFHQVFAWPMGDPPAWPWRKRAADARDSQRFRRLKELALSENNRAKALEFNAQELRSQRGHESHPLQDFLQFFYLLLSDYGRSVVRPLVALGVVTGLFAALYAQLSTKLSIGDVLPAALTYSGGNMFAFVPIGRNALEQSRAELFGEKVPYELLWIGGFQSVLSVILLFLLGLGLRNMFRL